MEPFALDGIRVECCLLHGHWIDIDTLGLAHDPAVVRRNEVIRTITGYALLVGLVGLELLDLFVL